MFQNSHLRALQFGTNLKNGATHVFHLIAGVLHRASECTDDDPIAIVSLDVKSLVEIAKCHPAVLVTGYADNTFFLGPIRPVTTSKAVPDFTKVGEKM